MNEVLNINPATFDAMEYVPVMVPTPLVPEVYGLIARRSAELGGSTVDLPADASIEGDGIAPVTAIEPQEPWADRRPWPQELLDKFARSTVSYTTVDRIANVLDVLSEMPERKLPTSEVCELTGYTRQQFVSALQKLTRHINKHYATDIGWPLRAVWGPDDGLPNPETYYWLSPEQADRWKSARSSS